MKTPLLPLLGFAALLLQACATTPPTSAQQPMSVRPPMREPAVVSNGSIYSASMGQRGLFEDRRARYVGDTITINLVERTQAAKNASTNASRSTSTSASIPLLSKLPPKFLQGLDVSAGSDNSLNGKGSSSADNNFTGTITVTVIDVLANGNLLVSGEKQLAINQGNEFIRFSGVINPANVTAGNTVNSVQVADARMEYRGSGYIDEAQQMGWLARFFQVISPF
ncbi:MAG: flagellar basal body L-ring protein FlgH [Betaproteobacteria bacterium]|nr:flagellar basal body L-ring protein FlgH [Betaproteobacteria bacterium]